MSEQGYDDGGDDDEFETPGCFDDLIEAPRKRRVLLPAPQVSEQQARKLWNDISIEDRVEDLCQGCGLHMIRSVAQRIAWLKLGGVAQCQGCGTRKSR